MVLKWSSDFLLFFLYGRSGQSEVMYIEDTNNINTNQARHVGKRINSFVLMSLLWPACPYKKTLKSTINVTLIILR